MTPENTPSESPSTGTEPSTWEYVKTTASVVSAIVAVIGFFMQRDENRKIIGHLKEIKAYLKQLDARIANIERREQKNTNSP